MRNETEELFRGELKFNKAMARICAVLDYIDSGKADHLFRDDETKAAIKAQFEAKAGWAILRFVDANPDTFYEVDGLIGLLPKKDTHCYDAPATR